MFAVWLSHRSPSVNAGAACGAEPEKLTSSSVSSLTAAVLPGFCPSATMKVVVTPAAGPTVNPSRVASAELPESDSAAPMSIWNSDIGRAASA